MNAKIGKKIGTVLLCAGFATVGSAWAGNCDGSSGQVESAASDRTQADASTIGADAGYVSRLDPKLYEYLHDPQIHKGDGLGQDFGSFAAVSAQR